MIWLRSPSVNRTYLPILRQGIALRLVRSYNQLIGILRRHLLDKVPISSLCDELGLQPTVFYRWQKEFFENGAAAFQAKAPSHHQPQQIRIQYLEKKIQTKDEVLAELMAEHIALKKSLGEL